MTIWANEATKHRHTVETSFSVFARTPRDALLWLTTVVAAYVVSIDDDVAPTIRDAISNYHADRRAVYRRQGRIRRSPKGWTRWAGVIEIDLIHPKIARVCSATKAGLLSELGIDVTILRSDQRILVVHEHAVLDHRGHASADAFMKDVRAAFPGARRVHAASIYSEGTVAQQLSNLAEYASKFRLRYSIAWNGRRTSYLGDYEPEWKEFVRVLYQKIGIQGLLNANITTQAKRSVQNLRMYTAQADLTGEISCAKPQQLCVAPNIITETDEGLINSPNCPSTCLELLQEEITNMLLHEIVESYVNPEIITADVHRELVGALRRKGQPLTPEERAVMYGDRERELRIEQQRLDAEKTRAEIGRIKATAARDRAEARRLSINPSG